MMVQFYVSQVCYESFISIVTHLLKNDLLEFCARIRIHNKNYIKKDIESQAL
jgi:hypothetical protein